MRRRATLSQRMGLVTITLLSTTLGVALAVLIIVALAKVWSAT